MNNERKGTGFWAVVQSVLAAFIGVQSKANKERDFKHGKPILYCWRLDWYGVVYILYLAGCAVFFEHRCLRFIVR